MKIIALDIGDQWTGIAISDATATIARPHTTVAAGDVETTLATLLVQEKVSTVVVGLPLTLKGTDSDQTKKTKLMAENLEKRFPAVTWQLWDERLTSKQVDRLHHARTKEEKLKAHARAAALILQTYLDYRALHQEQSASE